MFKLFLILFSVQAFGAEDCIESMRVRKPHDISPMPETRCLIAVERPVRRPVNEVLKVPNKSTEVEPLRFEKE